jgi:hypothetical protein
LVVVLRSPNIGSGNDQHQGSKVYVVKKLMKVEVNTSPYKHVGFGPTNDTVGKVPVGGGVSVGSNTGIWASEGNAMVAEPVQESSVHVPVDRSAGRGRGAIVTPPWLVWELFVAEEDGTGRSTLPD